MSVAGESPEVVVAELGPVPMSAAVAWLAQASKTLEVLRSRRPIDVPHDVVEAFSDLLAEWSASVGPGDQFTWSGEFDAGRLRRVAGHWAAVARAARTESVDVDAPSDEARPFYDELIAGVARALTSIPDEDGVGRTLLAVVPDFDESIGAPAGTRAPTPRRVLIVDDTEDIRFLISIGIRHHPGLEVCGEAVDGVDALDKAAALLPDAILLDLSMPRMSGLEALPELRRLVPTARIVVFSADPQARADALAAGAADFVEKGADPATVARALLGDLQAEV